MIDDLSNDITYCEAVLAPIWERWTDDPLLLRRTLAAVHAGEGSRAEQRRHLVAAIRAMVPRRDEPGINAAVCSGLAVLCLIGGDLDTDFHAVAAQAVAKDAEAALRRPAHGVSSLQGGGQGSGPAHSRTRWTGPERRVAGSGAAWTGVERRVAG